MSETTYSINQIAVVTGGQLILNCPAQSEIRNLLTDSRRVPVGGSFPMFQKLGIFEENIWIGGGNPKIYKTTNFGDDLIFRKY